MIMVAPALVQGTVPLRGRFTGVSFSMLVSSGYIPRSGIGGSYSAFTPGFVNTLHTVLYVAVSTYIPTNSARGFPFLHTFSSIYCL